MDLSSPVASPEHDSLDSDGKEDVNKKTLMTNFILAYRDLPVLWNSSLKEYSDRDKRKKKNLKKIKASIRTGAAAEDVYLNARGVKVSDPSETPDPSRNTINNITTE
ncbi:hypothetical protein ILUMI_14989, partial [Ignelater luminosus]